MKAIEHMSALLQKTNGVFKWENYGAGLGVRWENDHNVGFDKLDKRKLVYEYFLLNNYKNMKPLTQEANLAKRYK